MFLQRQMNVSYKNYILVFEKYWKVSGNYTRPLT